MDIHIHLRNHLLGLRVTLAMGRRVFAPPITITMKGFIEFVRKQGVVGLAVGFILGGAVSKFVSALVVDIVNPILGILLNKVGDLKDATWSLGSAIIKWGDFVSVSIDFVVVSAVVYIGVHLLGLDKLDQKS